MGALADALERAGPARVSGAKGLALLAQVAGRRGRGGAGVSRAGHVACV